MENQENEKAHIGFDYTKLIVGFGIFVIIGFLVITFGFDKPEEDSSFEQIAGETLSIEGAEGGDFMAADVDELVIEDQEVGTGEEAVAGKEVTVHYTGWLTDGTKFDSSVDRGQPFTFQLGAGFVIQGWDQGVAGMKVGGKRKLTIPSDLGYGDRGAGASIPPGATLVFEVELLEVN